MQEGIVPILIKHFDRSMLSSDTKNDNIAGFLEKQMFRSGCCWWLGKGELLGIGNWDCIFGLYFSPSCLYLASLASSPPSQWPVSPDAAAAQNPLRCLMAPCCNHPGPTLHPLPQKLRHQCQKPSDVCVLYSGTPKSAELLKRMYNVQIYILERRRHYFQFYPIHASGSCYIGGDSNGETKPGKNWCLVFRKWKFFIHNVCQPEPLWVLSMGRASWQPGIDWNSGIFNFLHRQERGGGELVHRSALKRGRGLKDGGEDFG